MYIGAKRCYGQCSQSQFSSWCFYNGISKCKGWPDILIVILWKSMPSALLKELFFFLPVRITWEMNFQPGVLFTFLLPTLFTQTHTCTRIHPDIRLTIRGMPCSLPSQLKNSPVTVYIWDIEGYYGLWDLSYASGILGEKIGQCLSPLGLL